MNKAKEKAEETQCAPYSFSMRRACRTCLQPVHKTHIRTHQPDKLNMQDITKTYAAGVAVDFISAFRSLLALPS